MPKNEAKKLLIEVDNDKIVLILPSNKKPNGQEFGDQKDHLRHTYSYFRNIHFHQNHPKYYPVNRSHIFSTAIGAFKEIRDRTKRQLKTKCSEEYFNMLIREGVIEKNPLEENLPQEEFDDLIYKIKKSILIKWWRQAQFPKDKFIKDCSYFNELELREIFIYLIGIQKYPAEDIKQLSAKDFRKILRQYGPINAYGILRLDITSKSISCIGSIGSGDQIRYKLNTLNAKEYHKTNTVTIIGVDTENDIIFYLDPDFKNTVFQVNITEFVNHLKYIYYFVCDKNKIDSNKTNQDPHIYSNKTLQDFHLHPYLTHDPIYKPCEHIINNLNTKKSISISSDMNAREEASPPQSSNDNSTVQTEEMTISIDTDEENLFELRFR